MAIQMRDEFRRGDGRKSTPKLSLLDDPLKVRDDVAVRHPLPTPPTLAQVREHVSPPVVYATVYAQQRDRWCSGIQSGSAMPTKNHHRWCPSRVEFLQGTAAAKSRTSFRVWVANFCRT